MMNTNTAAPDCETIRMSAMALRDGEKAELSEEEIKAHGRECAVCREVIEEDRVISDGFEGIRWVEMGEGVWEGVERRLRSMAEAGDFETRHRSRVVWWCIGAAACVAIAAIFAFWPNGTEKNNGAKPPLVKTPETPGVGGEEQPEALALVVELGEGAFGSDEGGMGQAAPFGSESSADDIAFGVIGEAFEKEGKQVLPIEIAEVYKGRLPTGRFDAEDRPVVRFECSMPTRRLGRRSKIFPPGTKVGIFLNRGESGTWSVSPLIRLGAGDGKFWRDQSRRYGAVEMAHESEDPVARYRELLPPTKPITQETYYALLYHPSPHAIPAVRAQWEMEIAKPEKEPGAYSETMYSLASLLCGLKDGESAESIFRYALSRNVGSRGQYLEWLTRLLLHTDDAFLERARDDLKEVLEALPDEKEINASGDAGLLGDYYGAISMLERVEALLGRPPLIDPWKPSEEEVRKIIVLGPPPSGRAAMGVYEENVRSSVIAIGVAGRPVSLGDGRRRQRLDIVDYLKGELPALADGKSAVCAFELPADSFRKDVLHEPGTRVALYLTGDAESGWDPLWMYAQSEANEEAWKKGVMEFLSVFEAGKLKNPAARYRDVLPEDPRQPLSYPAYYAIWQSRDGAAAPFVRARFDKSISGEMLSPGQTAGGNPRKLIELLARVNDAKSVGMVLEYIRGVRGGKGSYHALLPELCRRADEKALEEVETYLEGYLEELPEEKEVMESNDEALMSEYFETREALEAIKD